MDLFKLIWHACLVWYGEVHEAVKPFLPIHDSMTREEAAQFLLQRRLQIRYTPMIVEMDRNDNHAREELDDFDNRRRH